MGSLAGWRDFKKQSTDEEFLTVLWSTVLKVPEEKIARGLNISVGTVRYRLGKGLKKLGDLLESPYA